MKKIILIIVILLLAGGSFAFFKFNNIKEAQGKILEQIGQGSLFNNLFKKAGSFIEENIKETIDKKGPEIKKELEKEKQEFKSEIGSISKQVLEKFQPLDHIGNIINNNFNNNSAIDSLEEDNINTEEKKCP